MHREIDACTVIPPGGGCALPGLQGPLTGSYLVGPVSAAPPGDDSRHGAAFMPGGGCALPGLRGPLTGSYLVGPVSASPPGDDSRHRADFVPGGGCALPGLQGPLPGLHLVAPASAAPPGRSDLLLSDNLQRGFTHPRVPHHRQQTEPDQAGDQRHPRLGKHPQHSDDQPHKQQR